MKNTWPKFQQALKSIHVEFELLPGELEAKYGGISSLKLAAPYVPDCSSWVVIEMGGKYLSEESVHRVMEHCS